MSPPAKRARLDPDVISDVRPDTLRRTMELPPHDSRPIHFSQPSLLTSFSYDASRTQKFDDSSRKYFVPPTQPRGLDLRRGFQDSVWRPEDLVEGLDGLLHSLEKLPENQDELLQSCKVVTWRGMLTKLATAAYESRDHWAMNAQLFDVCLSITVNAMLISLTGYPVP